MRWKQDHSKSPTTLNIPWIMDAQLEIVYGAIAEVHIPRIQDRERDVLNILISSAGSS